MGLVAVPAHESEQAAQSAFPLFRGDNRGFFCSPSIAARRKSAGTSFFLSPSRYLRATRRDVLHWARARACLRFHSCRSRSSAVVQSEHGSSGDSSISAARDVALSRRVAAIPDL